MGKELSRSHVLQFEKNISFFVQDLGCVNPDKIVNVQQSKNRFKTKLPYSEDIIAQGKRLRRFSEE